MNSSSCSNVQLWLDIEEEWHLVLVIPVEDILRLCIYPLKWLRFIAATFYGGDGVLHSDSPLSPAIDQYMATDLTSKYYFVSPEKGRPLDPLALDDRTSAIVSQPRNTAFRHLLIARDRWCITYWTNDDPSSATACHIIPHSRGSEYMQNLFNSRYQHLENPVSDIDDVRNGILLHQGLHSAYVNARLTLLQVPNDYLSPSDIPLCSNPSKRSPDGPHAPRLVLQHLGNLNVSISDIAAHNSDRRIPTFSPPAQYILDFTYACAVLHKWGSPNNLRSKLPHPLRTEGVMENLYSSPKEFPDTDHDNDFIGTPKGKGSPTTGRQHRLDTPFEDEEALEKEGYLYAMDAMLGFGIPKKAENKRVCKWVEETSRHLNPFNPIEDDNVSGPFN